jgi:ribosomal protein S17E
MFATKEDNKAVVEQLIGAGANKDLRNKVSGFHSAVL